MLTAPRLTCHLFVLLLTRLMGQRIVLLAGVSRRLSSVVVCYAAGRTAGQSSYVRPVRATP